MSNILPIDPALFEKIVIYNALTDSTFLESIVEYANPSYFIDPDIKLVFSHLNQYYKTYERIPNITELKIHLITQDDRQALKNVVLGFNSIDKTYDKEVLLKNTERFLREKAVHKTVIKTSLEIQSGTFNTSNILKEFQSACSICLTESLGFDYLENVEQHCQELLKTSKTISTGWNWLDDKIGGGLLSEGRALYVFYGVTNVGKSIFLGNIAANILNQNKTVLLISLEMSEQVYAKRMSSHLSQIAMVDIPSEIPILKKELNTYKAAHNNSKLIIKEFPPQTITPIQIKAYIEKLNRNGITPDAIVIDYLNLIAPPEKGKNSYESVKAITEQIRALSYHFNCPVISATQTNRSAYGEANPGLETMSESMGLAHTADAQFSIWSEEGDIELGQIHLGVTKNRFGSVGAHTVLEIDYPTLTLRDCSDISNSKPNKSVMPGAINAINDISNTLKMLEKFDNND